MTVEETKKRTAFPKTEQLITVVTKGMRDKVDQLAADKEMSRSELMRSALTEYLERNT